MARTLLVRGMLAGLLAAVCAIAVSKALAEPQIARAEAFERHLDVQLGKPAEHMPVSRDVQDTIGLGAGVAVVGVGLGGLFGLAFAATYRRVGRAGAHAHAALLAAGGCLAVFVVPFLKYPANPPSVGNPDTLGRRTALYFLCVAAGLLSLALATMLQRRSLPRLGGWNATLLGGGMFVAVVALVYAVMPGFNEVPPGFPASVLWAFRLGSAASQLALWAALGLGFGALTVRAETRYQATASRRESSRL